jgi:hypothetical protein
MMMRVGLEPTQINLLAPEASALTARPSHLVAYSNSIRYIQYIADSDSECK